MLSATARRKPRPNALAPLSGAKRHFRCALSPVPGQIDRAGQASGLPAHPYRHAIESNSIVSRAHINHCPNHAGNGRRSVTTPRHKNS
ncbi:hypothetical protein [Haladaptatus caseinilyticus]|uniref:hypothetical protein n=1 Tax=Haladaptatus caseinilyticus TaxID=2993314 RepID=UPI00224AF127|nr:hypothetical protein [Haladaptatus caseinilyticus]